MTFVLGQRRDGDWVLEPHPARMAERCVMVALANHASSDTFECWPALETIAGEAGLGGSEAARVVLRRLADKGWIEIVRHGAPDRRIRADRRPNLYRILDDGRDSDVAVHPSRGAVPDSRSCSVAGPTRGPEQVAGSMRGEGSEQVAGPDLQPRNRPRHDPLPHQGPSDSRPPAPPGHDPLPHGGPPEPRPPVPPGHDPLSHRGLTVTRTKTLSSSSENGFDTDAAELDDEDDQVPEQLPDEITSQIADRLLDRRLAELPDKPVRKRNGWLATTRQDLRHNPHLPAAAVKASHPSLGATGSPSRQIDLLADLHDNGEWPTPPPARRAVIPDPNLSTTVDTSGPRTPMPDHVRTALGGT